MSLAMIIMKLLSDFQVYAEASPVLEISSTTFSSSYLKVAYSAVSGIFVSILSPDLS